MVVLVFPDPLRRRYPSSERRSRFGHQGVGVDAKPSTWLGGPSDHKFG